jgi:hypothetical protein
MGRFNSPVWLAHQRCNFLQLDQPLGDLSDFGPVLRFLGRIKLPLKSIRLTLDVAVKSSHIRGKTQQKSAVGTVALPPELWFDVVLQQERPTYARIGGYRFAGIVFFLTIMCVLETGFPENVNVRWAVHQVR